jgi:hypothetical protein
MRSSPHLKRSSPLTHNQILISDPQLELKLKRTPNPNPKSLLARCVLCPALAPECPICAASQTCTLTRQTCTECAFAACVAQGVAPPASNIPTLSPIGAPTTATATATVPTIPGGLPLPTKSTMDPSSMDMMSTAAESDTAMASMTGMTMTDSVMSMATGTGTMMGSMMGSGSAMTMATATGMSGMTTATVSAMMSSQMMGSGSMSATGSAGAMATTTSMAGAAGRGGMGSGMEGVLALVMVVVGLVVR